LLFHVSIVELTPVLKKAVSTAGEKVYFFRVLISLFLLSHPVIITYIFWSFVLTLLHIIMKLISLPE